MSLEIDWDRRFLIIFNYLLVNFFKRNMFSKYKKLKNTKNLYLTHF